MKSSERRKKMMKQQNRHLHCSCGVITALAFSVCQHLGYGIYMHLQLQSITTENEFLYNQLFNPLQGQEEAADT